MIHLHDHNSRPHPRDIHPQTHPLVYLLEILLIHANDESEKDQSYNSRDAIKFIIDYYNKQDQLSGSIDEDWQRHVSQSKSLCEEYQADPNTLLRHFGHPLQHKSQAYHYYQAL